MPQSQTAALPRPQEEEETYKIKQAQIEQTYEKHKDLLSFPWKVLIFTFISFIVKIFMYLFIFFVYLSCYKYFGGQYYNKYFGKKKSLNNHKPQLFPDPKRKRKHIKPNKANNAEHILQNKKKMCLVKTQISVHIHR